MQTPIAGVSQARMLGEKVVAQLLGVPVEQMRLAETWERYGFPPPDGHIGKSQWWWSTTVEAWTAGAA